MLSLSHTSTAILPFILFGTTLISRIHAHPLSTLQTRQQEQDTASEKATGLYISSIRDGSCLSTNDTTPVIGSQLTLTSCEQAELWHVPLGDGLLGLDTVGLVWDFDEIGDGIHITEPVQDSTNQLWKWSSDNRISTLNQSVCLQHTKEGPKRASCDSQDVDQVWILRNTSQPHRFEDITKQDDLNRGGYIHPFGRNDICLSAISNAEAHPNSGIALTYCSGKGDNETLVPIQTSESLMTWNLPKSSIEKGQIKLSSSNLCLESGSKTPNGIGYDWSFTYGMGVTLRTCGNEDVKGQWWIWDGKRIRVAGDDGASNQCLNILGGSGPIQMNNFLNLRPMQLWTCDESDENSMFSAS